MNFLEEYSVEMDGDDWSEKIERTFSRFGVQIKIVDWRRGTDRLFFIIKLKGKTREQQLMEHVSDVQLRLKLPLLKVNKVGFTLYLVASDRRIEYAHLPEILSAPDYMQRRGKMSLPYVVGYDMFGELVVADLCKFPHLLFGGSTNSGKSVGLQALITSIAYTMPPHRVNFILIDVGASDLMPFKELPHLSYPIVQNITTALLVLMSLHDEMEKRIAIENTDEEIFKKLPRLVLVVDEFPALFAGCADKEISKMIADIISSILQRGRHAKIHIVLAAQNPTIQNMKIDLSNISARVAFKCAKSNFSEVILGEKGAEKLTGQGELLFKHPGQNEVRQIQGSYISKKELQATILRILMKYSKFKYHNLEKFTISQNVVEQSMISRRSQSRLATVNFGVRNKADREFAKTIVWALGQQTVSCNLIMRKFNLGWKRAHETIDRLQEFGIVDELDAKLPRKIIPKSVGDLSNETLDFMERFGFTVDELENTINATGNSV